MPTIAIVGRPNVGKSTLFNRLIDKRHAVVAQEAGTTRDRISHKCVINGYEVFLVDTGGLISAKQENIEANVQAQAQMAIEDADLILFVTDISQELTVDDFAAADILRKSKKPTLLVANKTDNPNLEQKVYNLYELGFGDAITISSIHNLGIDELKNLMVKNFKKLKFKKAVIKAETDVTNICILGKPNAGKSSLLNALVGYEKVIVSDIPGTTRDAIDTEVIYNEKKYNLIDTAGLKRPGKTKYGIDKFSALRALNAIERSDVIILLIDGTLRISNQDAHIVEYALEQKKGLILAINKTDLFEDYKEQENYVINQLRKKFVFVPWAPIVFLSAKNKTNIEKLLDLTEEISKERRKRVPTNEFNTFMQKIIYKHLPTSAKYKKPRFMYATQVDVNPPKFAIFMKNAANLHFSYPRYIENEIRKEYGFTGTAIELSFKNTVKESSDSRFDRM